MEVKYLKGEQGITQNVIQHIDANTDQVFPYLSTTEGIQQWFPQLSFKDQEVGGTVVFNMEDTRQEMEITHYEPNKVVGFTWDKGTVKFVLAEMQGSTQITLEEHLPHEFPHIAADFTGWQFHMKSIQQLVEKGSPLDQQNYNFDQVTNEIKNQLDL